MSKIAQRDGIISSLFKFIFVLMLIAIASLLGGYYYLEKVTHNQGPLEQSTIIWVKPGSSLSKIATELTHISAIKSDLIFKIETYRRGLQSSLQAGEYEIPAHSSIDEILDILTEGKPYLHKMTFAEGLTTQMILQAIQDNDVLSGEITIAPAEGVLLPETYSFPRGMKRDDLIQQMQKAQTDLITLIWPQRVDGLPFDSKEEAIILASIVEKETGIASERARVAAVFVNRLKRGMRLESDPTIIYGLTGGAPLGRGIRQSELRKETPYNTYVIKGLPPTPIANPGEGALRAVLHPADTKEIFFVADGSGGHVFAETLAQHNANVRKWRQIERQNSGN
ncbi:MAG: endolytic transglycosylase MltG [bacterium]